MALMGFSGEAAEQGQMVLEELFLMLLFLLPFPRVLWQSHIDPICISELDGHGYFCSIRNASPQLEKTPGVHKQEVGIARAEFRIPPSTL